MGGSQKTQSSYTPDPQALAAYHALFPQAEAVAQTPWNPATGMQVAGFNPQQTQAFNQIGQLQGGYQPYLNQAQQYTQNAAGPISKEAIQGYMNPYQQDVINATMAQLGQQQGQQLQNLNAGAIGQNALGGNRADIARAVLQGQQGLATGSTLANLNQANYGQALSAAQQDSIRQLSAGQQMAGLGQLGQNLGLQGAQALYGAGATQQGLEQQQLNAATQNAQSQQMWPYQNLQWLSSIYSGIGPLMGGVQIGKTSQTPGIGNMVGMGLTGLSMLNKGGKVQRAADGGEIKYAADGGIMGSGSPFGTSSFFPWAPITPGRSIMPQNVGQLGQGQPNSLSSMQDMMKLGQKARSGLHDMLGALGGDSSGLDNSQAGGGLSRLGNKLGSLWGTLSDSTASGLGSLFNYANGGAPHMAGGGFVGVGPDAVSRAWSMLPAASTDRMPEEAPSQDPSYLSKIYQNVTSSNPRSIFEDWTPPPMPERRPNFEALTEATPAETPMRIDTPMQEPTAVQAESEMQAPEEQPAKAFPNITAQGFESGTADRVKSLYNYSPDRGESRSIGAYGLNTLPGYSAWQFRDEAGKALGITADPNTPEFHQQWLRAAQRDPQALIAAEDAWHDKHVVGPTIRGLTAAGLPPEIAGNPAVQAYAADRVVQYGEGLAFGPKSKARWQQAFNESNGDYTQMLQNMSQLDKQNIGTDFYSYLAERPQDAPGLMNRIDKRLASSMVGGGQQAPDRLAWASQEAPSERGPSARAQPTQTPPQTPPQTSPQQNDFIANLLPSGVRRNETQGGLLSGLLGHDLNLMNWTPEQRQRFQNIGIGLMSNNMQPWAGAMQGQQMNMQQEQLNRQNSLAQMQMMLQARQLNQPIVIGEEPDPWGGPVRKIYGVPGPNGQFVPTPMYGGNQGGVDGSHVGALGMPAQIQQAYEQGLTGDQFMAALPPQDQADVQSLLDGRMQAPANSGRNPRFQRLMSYAHQIDNQFDAGRYGIRQAAMKNFATGGFFGKQVTFSGTSLDHLGKIWDISDKLGNVNFTPLNSVMNYAKEKLGYPAIMAFKSERDLYVKELDKLFSAGPGAAHERDRMVSNLDAANSLPQLKEVIKSQASFLLGRMNVVAQQRLDAVGEKTTLPPILDRRSRDVIKKVGLGDELTPLVGEPGKAPQEEQKAPAQQATTTDQRPTISTKAQYDALPSGAEYIDARDGSHKRKS